MHLAPGVANIGATVVGFSCLLNPDLPPELIYGVLVNVLVLIPIQLGFLFYLAKKRGNKGFSLKGVVVLAKHPRIRALLLWTLAILIPTAIIFGLFEPVTNKLDSLISWSLLMPLSTAYSDAESTRLVLMLNILLTGIAVPITEELYFRGYLLPRMPIILGRSGPACHSFLFAIYHFDTPWMIPVRTIGLLPLIYVALHTQSTRPGMLAHCLVNLADFVAAVSNRWKS